MLSKLSKRIAAVIGVTVLALFWCSPVTAQTTIREIKACNKIGNIQGTRPVTCIDDGGTYSHRGFLTFQPGDDIYILARFRNLPVATHRLTVIYERANLHGVYSEVNVKVVPFKNDTRNWAQWFRSDYRSAGRWRVRVLLRGQMLGSVRYCVDCVGDDGD